MGDQEQHPEVHFAEGLVWELADVNSRLLRQRVDLRLVWLFSPRCCRHLRLRTHLRPGFWSVLLSCFLLFFAANTVWRIASGSTPSSYSWTQVVSAGGGWTPTDISVGAVFAELFSASSCAGFCVHHVRKQRRPQAIPLRPLVNIPSRTCTALSNFFNVPCCGQGLLLNGNCSVQITSFVHFSLFEFRTKTMQNPHTKLTSLSQTQIEFQ